MALTHRWPTASATTSDLLDVVAALGLVGHRLDHLVGDRGAVGFGSVRVGHRQG
jgi:hypothetical protein